VKSVESQATFLRNISPPSSGLKNIPRKKAAWKQVASRVIGWSEIFGLYRKQEGNGRVDFSYHWLAVEQNETVGALT
jgi:hypothetical protein